MIRDWPSEERCRKHSVNFVQSACFDTGFLNIERPMLHRANRTTARFARFRHLPSASLIPRHNQHLHNIHYKSFVRVRFGCMYLRAHTGCIIRVSREQVRCLHYVGSRVWVNDYWPPSPGRLFEPPDLGSCPVPETRPAPLSKFPNVFGNHPVLMY